MRKTAWRYLEDNPPALIRLFARRRTVSGVVAMSLHEIAIASGLGLARCRQIAESDSWDNVTVGEAQRFIAGCGWDPLNYKDRNRKYAYIASCQKARTKFHYLRQSPLWETEFKPLIRRLRSRMVA